MPIFQGTTAGAESATPPVKTSAQYTVEQGRILWLETYEGSLSQISAFVFAGVPNYPTSYSVIEGANPRLEVRYETRPGEIPGTANPVGEHVSEHWRVDTVTVERLLTEHPTIQAQGYLSTNLSYKEVTFNQRMFLAELIGTGKKHKWADEYRLEGVPDTVPKAPISDIFDGFKDASDTGKSVPACKAIYEYYLQTGNTSYPERKYQITRRVRFNSAWASYAGGIAPAAMLKEQNAFAAEITTFASVSVLPERIEQTLSNLALDLSYPDWGYNNPPAGIPAGSRSSHKFLKTSVNFTEVVRGDVDIYETWTLEPDPSPLIYLDLDA